MKGLTLFIMMALLPSATFAETAGQAEVRQELERMFAPTPGPRPHPSQVITPLIRKYGRENVADIAVQPLTAALKGTNNYFMQEQIAWALFELKDPRSVGPLVEFLRIEKFGDWGAEKTLIAIGEPAVAPLVEAFRSGNTNQQFLQKAAKVLGELKDVRAVAGLIEGLASNDRSLPRVCAEALASIGGTDAVDGLVAALKAGNPVAKLSATKALGPMKNPRTVPALIELLKDKDRNLRGEAARALGEIGDPAAIDALVTALTDSKAGVEGEACAALSKMRNSGAAAILLERFRAAKNPAERHSLLRALTYMGDRGLEAIIETLGDENAEVRHAALQSLHSMSTSTVAAEGVSESNQQRARQAILAYFEAGKADEVSYPERVNIIASIQEPRAVQLALRTLKKKQEGYEDAPWYVPQDIYIAFEKAKPYVIDPLIEGLNDPDPSVRAGAAAVLGHLPLRMYGAQPEVDGIKDRIAKVLTKAVSDSKEHEAVREKAAIALGTIADSRHTPALLAVLKDKTAALTVRRAAAHGFVMKADRGLVPDFLQIFRDKSDDPYVRVEVAHVLQGIERKHSDASIGAALKAVRMDRSEPAAVRAVARSTQELMDRLKAHSAGGVVKANTSANQVPYGKQVWPNGIIKNITKMAERTIVEAEAQGTRPEIKTWYDKQFADWKIYNEWNTATITVSGDGEWKVWIRQNVCCLVTIRQDSRGRIDILHAFDREEDLQDLLAGIPLEQEQRARCKRNLQAIESAKGKARRNLRLKAEATLDAAQLSPFIPGGFQALSCPNAGQYTIGAAHGQARCSVHGTQAALGRR